MNGHSSLTKGKGEDRVGQTRERNNGRPPSCVIADEREKVTPIEPDDLSLSEEGEKESCMLIKEGTRSGEMRKSESKRRKREKEKTLSSELKIKL